MAANEKLIQSMLKCDGTRKNCARCVFKEHPDCRNAMAHHAGALIQLQDVVVENLGVIQRKALMERDMHLSGLKTTDGQLSELKDSYGQLIQHLRDRKDCGSCAVKAGTSGLTEEECKVCCGNCAEEDCNNWRVDPKIIAVDPCKRCEREDCEGCEHFEEEGEDEEGNVLKRID